MYQLQLPDGSTIRWTELPGAEPALVVVHGLGASAVGHFLHVVTHPALLGRRVLFIDLLGFGLSDRPQDFDYSIESHARAVGSVLDRGLGSVDAVGHSLGGSIAIHLAHLRPDLVGRLVAIEPNLDPWDGTASVMIARQSEDGFVESGFATLLRAADPSWRASLRLADPVALHRTSVGLCAGPTPVMRQTLLEAELPRILVWGQLSPPPRDLEQLRSARVAYVEIPDAGHVPMEDNPDALARALGAALPLP
jgi:pimeloyl-ACP methyl ester carboxylesterase